MSRYSEERRYSMPWQILAPACEDLHAWSIYRQNLNSDFTDSALGSSDKSPLPYGNFQLRDATVQSILSHPRYGPKCLTPLTNVYTYLKFGLPRVFPQQADSLTIENFDVHVPKKEQSNNLPNDNVIQNIDSTDYETSDNELASVHLQSPKIRKFRSESDFQLLQTYSNNSRVQNKRNYRSSRRSSLRNGRQKPLSVVGDTIGNSYWEPNIYQRSQSEANIFNIDRKSRTLKSQQNLPTQVTDNEHLFKPFQLQNLKYPILQVNKLAKNTNLHGITFKASAGDAFAVMATNANEGTLLMKILAGLKSKTAGDFILNGQAVDRNQLKKICSFVPSIEEAPFDPDMDVQSTLLFHASFKRFKNLSNRRKLMEKLIEDLGLSALKNEKISKLTHSEKQRLNVACQLFSQTSILIVDKMTENLDIFDTFFLVEYLKQWCSKSKIVIMTLQPPTFEIFSMCSTILLLSKGRTIFVGGRENLAKYMSMMGYPCPPYKNPADYYLDLVTLDDLSSAALIESSFRIDSLANAWTHFNPYYNIMIPRASLPLSVNYCSKFKQFSTLVKRVFSYQLTSNIIFWILNFTLAIAISLMVGIVFWDASNSFILYDHIGMQYVLMAIAVWPLLVNTVYKTSMKRDIIEKELSLSMYSRTLYIFIQVLLSIIPNICNWIVYIIPAYSMSGLLTFSNDVNVYIYLGLFLLYLLSLHSYAVFCAFICNSPLLSVILLAITICPLLFVGGYMIQGQNISVYFKWMQSFSPTKWLIPIIIDHYYNHETLRYFLDSECAKKEVQYNDIIVRDNCSLSNANAFLNDLNLFKNHSELNLDGTLQMLVCTLGVILLVLYALIIFIFSFKIRLSFNSNKINN